MEIQIESEHFIRKSNTQLSSHTQRIYLCFDSSNLELVNTLITEILSSVTGTNCVVSFPKSIDTIDQNELLDEILLSQVMVLLVSNEMMESVNKNGLPIEYILAKDNNIPIFPIATYNDILKNMSENIGKIHAISQDDPEYKTKLKEQIDNFILSDELRNEIDEKAFTAEIFLSYRKVDLNEARKFMEGLHCIEGLEGISIWYDHYLTAGKDFDKEIEEAIESSKAFVLLITPNITLENVTGEKNYVANVEIPLAVKKQKPIIPFEAQQRDEATFAVWFPDLKNELISKSELNKIFKAKLGDDVYIKNLGTERAYLLGNAYLKGHKVERNEERASKLLEIATKGDDIFAYKAANQLAHFMYEYCYGYDYFIHWKKTAVDIGKNIFGSYHPEIAKSLVELGRHYSPVKSYEEALLIYNELAKTEAKIYMPEILSTMIRLAVAIEEEIDDPDRYTKVISLFKDTLNIARDSSVINPDLNNIANILYKIGALNNKMKNYSEAEKYYNESLKIRRNLTTHHSYKDYLVATLTVLGITYSKNDKNIHAEESYLEALNICRERIKGERKGAVVLFSGCYNDSVQYKVDYPKNIDTVLKTLADFLIKLNRYSEAENYYNDTIKYFKELPNIPFDELTTILSSLANLQENNNHYEVALRNYKEVLQIKQESFICSNEKEMISFYKVSDALKSLTELLLKLNRFSDAETYYNETLKILKDNANNDSDKYLKAVVDILKELATLQKESSQFAKAETSYSEVINVLSDLAEKYPDKYSEDVYDSYINLANLQKEIKEYDKALSNYTEALKIPKKYAGMYRTPYLALYAKTLNYFAKTYIENNHDKEAETCYLEALQIFNDIAFESQYSRDFYSEVVWTLGNLIELQKKTKNYNEAEKNIEKVLDIINKIYESDRFIFFIEWYARTLRLLAYIQKESNRYTEAEDNLVLALDNYKRRNSRQPDNYLLHIADTLHNLAFIQYKAKKYKEAEENFTESIKFNPDDGYSFYFRGRIYVDKEDYKKALEDFTEAIRLNNSYSYPFFCNIRCGDYLKDLEDFTDGIRLKPSCTYSYVHRAFCYEKLNDIHNALNDYTEAVKLNPKDYYSYNRLGVLYHDMGLYKDAVFNFNETLKFSPHNTDGILRDLSLSSVKMGDSLKKLGKLTEAEIYYQQHLEVARTLYERSGTANTLNDLLVAYDKAGDNKYELELQDDALTYRLKALELFKQYVKLNPLWKNYTDYFRNKVSQIKQKKFRTVLKNIFNRFRRK